MNINLQVVRENVGTVIRNRDKGGGFRKERQGQRYIETKRLRIRERYIYIERDRDTDKDILERDRNIEREKGEKAYLFIAIQERQMNAIGRGLVKFGLNEQH